MRGKPGPGLIVDELIQQAIDKGIRPSTEDLTDYICNHLTINQVQDVLRTGVSRTAANRLRKRFDLNVYRADGTWEWMAYEAISGDDLERTLSARESGAEADEEAIEVHRAAWQEVHPEGELPTEE